DYYCSSYTDSNTFG
nr:immunoglobulin light chain junction region [Macaca mulatta]MOW66828.1 immunoglobulin light chain junction region [Macaca mulatta]MOW71322.1 immunoglobulin light chain junction region [Macaca mulatta]